MGRQTEDLKQARTPASGRAAATLSLAAEAHSSGQLDRARALCLQVLEQDARNADALHLLALVEHSAGRAPQAVAMLRRALTLQPRNAGFHANLAAILRASGDMAGALESARKSVELDPKSAGAQNNLGLLQLDEGNLKEAETSFRRSLDLAPNSAGTLANLARAVARQNRLEEAVALHLQAVQLAPDMAEAQHGLGLALFQLQRIAESVEPFRKAVSLRPNWPEAHLNLSIALLKTLQPEAAREAAERTLALRPEMAEAHNTLAQALMDLGRTAEALPHAERALALSPATVDFRWTLALLQLQMGEMPEGWLNLEARCQMPELGVRERSEPAWRGQPLTGERILLHAEQGLGDSLQFLRYVPLVAAAGGKVVLDLPRRLHRLAASLEGVAELTAGLQLSEPCQWQCPLMSLPLAFRTRVESIPASVPYLHPSEAARRQAAKLPWPQDALRVGLAWTGSKAHAHNSLRSVSLDLLEPLFLLNRVRFYSLQLEADPAELARRGIVDLAPATSEMDDTAAQMEHLDLILTIDTSIAHLAGALGRRCWLLLAEVADYRWLLKREDSPWYPTIKLYRQPERGNWDAVISRVLADLTALAATPANVQFAEPIIQPAPLPPNPLLEALAVRAATLIPAGARVLQLCHDCFSLDRFLPDGAHSTTELLSAGSDRLPLLHAADSDLLLALDLISNETTGVDELLRNLAAAHLPLVLAAPAARGAEVLAAARSAGLEPQAELSAAPAQLFWRFSATSFPPRKPQRVGVLSFRHVGNFGDRLGVHLLPQVLPAQAEVVHIPLGTGSLPDEAFDLLLVGMGNSIFGHLIDDQLLHLVERSRVAVGIFGTQYHPSMPRTLLGKLLDRLDHWYARHEEDLFRYGQNRKNTSHLGDWLIQAFPMARPTRDERLEIGQEVWQDLPLDRTIDAIQQYTTVISPRIHPLLCAFTSAHQVAYREQHESSDLTCASGKFRSMLMDIFGRDYPEGELFAVDRQQVMRYKAKVATRIDELRSHLDRLLG